MRTLRRIGVALATIFAIKCAAQDWMAGPLGGGPGNVISGTEYLGAAATSTVPLLLQTVPNGLSIDFATAANLRMRLNGNLGSGTINGYTVNRDGFLSVSARPNFYPNTPGAFTRLHLVDNEGSNAQNTYANQSGYRTWMRNGVTFTGNTDLGYIGQAYDGSGVSDMVLNWSDETTTGPWTADRLRFVFTADNTGGTNGMTSAVGLEAMRMWPADADNVNVGIGDWLVSGSGDPSERLDILTGRVKIRDLPGATASTYDDIVVVDPDGILEHRPISSFPEFCEWTMDASAPNNVWTAFGTSDPDCPDDDDNVGIGDDAPVGKLTVLRKDATGSGANIGILTTTDSDNGSNNYAIQALCDGLTGIGGPAPENYGMDVLSKNGTKTFGINCQALMELTTAQPVFGTFSLGTVTGESAEVYGVYARAQVTDDGETSNAIGVLGHGLNEDDDDEVNEVAGVWGVVSGQMPAVARYGVYGDAPQGAPDSWAGYFDGDVQITSDLYNATTSIFSDQTIKDNIAAIQDATGILAQLEPRTYVYNNGAAPQLGLPSGTHMGMIAQEVAQVLPDVVSQTRLAPGHDENGVVTDPPLDLLAVNYTEFIPLLVAGFQEQQAHIAAQDQQITSLQDQINGCCTEGMAPEGGNGIGYIDNTASGTGNTRDLQADELVVTPNPFTENPTISYRIGTSGRAQLRVTSASSRDMGVLYDRHLEAGQHSMVWNTVGMAPGLYLLTLTVDGKRVTEQAVKVE